MSRGDTEEKLAKGALPLKEVLEMATDAVKPQGESLQKAARDLGQEVPHRS